MADDWIARYATSHRHPVNRLLHTIGIPMIAARNAIACGGIRSTVLSSATS